MKEDCRSIHVSQQLELIPKRSAHHTTLRAAPLPLSSYRETVVIAVWLVFGLNIQKQTRIKMECYTRNVLMSICSFRIVFSPFSFLIRWLEPYLCLRGPELLMRLLTPTKCTKETLTRFSSNC